MKSDDYALFDLAQWKNGLAFKKINFSSSGKPVIKIAELKNGITDQTQFTDGDYGDEVHLTKGDMLFSWSGNPETSIDVFWYNLPDGWLNQHIFKITPKPFVDRNFLYYILKYLKPNFIAIASNKQTTGLGHITIKDLKAETISLPSMKVQKIISDYLFSIDQKINANQAINDNLEQQAVLKVDQYFSATTKIVALSEIMDFVNGFAFQSSTYLPVGQYRIITIKNVQDGRIDSAGAAYIDCLPERMKKNCILEIGDALMSLTGNVGRVGIVCEDSLLLNQRVAKIVPHYKNFLPFLYFIFRKSSIKTQMESMAKGTAQLNLSPIEALNLSIPFERMTALAISKILKPIYQAIISNNQQNILLTALRDALLPKLMSDELDVSELDI